MSDHPVVGDNQKLAEQLETSERELRVLREHHGLLLEETRSLGREASARLAELAELIARQREAIGETRECAETLAAIRASNSWRLLQQLGRRRVALRAFRMKMRGQLSSRRRRAPRVPVRVREAALGVNVTGYITAESGMGEAVRASIRALERANVPVALHNVESGLRTHDASYTDFTTRQPHLFNLVHLNADNMEAFARQRGPSYFRGRYTIGYWFWELSTFREDWYPAFNHIQEVWVASQFTKECLEGVSPVPIVHVPLGLSVPAPPPQLGRAHFGIRDGVFVFLFMFDVSSHLERKNPLAVIRAFRRAHMQKEALLVLKFTNGSFNRDAVRRLHEEATGLPVLMLDGYMGREELSALLNVADCYVSLHRAEGLGLTIAEAMAHGKPVIATAYSGNMDFMTPENSIGVNYRMVKLNRDYGPYLRGFAWAEPDVAEASRRMREVVEQPELGARLGMQAADDIAKQLSVGATASRIRRRLEAIRGGRIVPIEPCGLSAAIDS